MDASRLRTRFAPIDQLISILEQRNLDEDRTLDRGLRERVRQLEDTMAAPVPRRALRARNTARLHAALLDWREVLLDAMLPEGPGIAEMPSADQEATAEDFPGSLE